MGFPLFLLTAAILVDIQGSQGWAEQDAGKSLLSLPPVCSGPGPSSDVN